MRTELKRGKVETNGKLVQAQKSLLKLDFSGQIITKNFPCHRHAVVVAAEGVIFQAFKYFGQAVYSFLIFSSSFSS